MKKNRSTTLRAKKASWSVEGKDKARRALNRALVEEVEVEVVEVEVAVEVDREDPGWKPALLPAYTSVNGTVTVTGVEEVKVRPWVPTLLVEGLPLPVRGDLTDATIAEMLAA